MNVIPKGPFMSFGCKSYEEFASGRCTQDKNACLLNDKALDNKSNITDDNNYLQCLRMGFEADISWKLNHKLIDKNSNTIGVKTQSRSSSTVNYFLQTSDQNPFCQYHYHIKIYCKSRKDLTVGNVEKGRLFIQIFGSKSWTQYLEASKE